MNKEIESSGKATAAGRDVKQKKSNMIQIGDIRGGRNIVAPQGDVYIHEAPTRTNTIAEVKPGIEHISDEQAAALHALVNKVVETEARLKQKPRAHQTVWSAVNAHCGVPRYRLIKTVDFAKARKYLHEWIGRLDSMASAPVKDGDAWRKRKYAYIKINSKGDPAALDRYIARNFKASSITELDNQQLEQVYRYVAGRKSKK
jgi:hypothetical protein